MQGAKLLAVMIALFCIIQVSAASTPAQWCDMVCNGEDMIRQYAENVCDKVVEMHEEAKFICSKIDDVIDFAFESAKCNCRRMKNFEGFLKFLGLRKQ